MITIVETNHELHIDFNGKPVIHHSLEKPAFFIGKGFSTYEMYHGNFDIRSELESKIPLINFKVIESNQTQALIRFSN
jgi:alpha-glucosidase